MSEALAGLAVFVTAALIAFGLTPVFRRRALARGHVDRPGGRKDQAAAVPYAGGRAILVAFALTIIGGAYASVALEGLEVVGRHVGGLNDRFPTLVAIVGGAAIMAAMGRADDRRSLRPGWRLVIQLLAALPMALSDQRLTLFVADPTLQVLLSLLWLVFMTNAANFIDNMDGLLAGAALIAVGAFALHAAIFGQLFVAAFALALAGSIAGVLPWNRRPARVYLGDEGSMFLGFVLGVLAMVTSYREPGGPRFLPFAVPLLFLALPVLDALAAIGGRILRGAAPWRAGRDHLSHRLVARGFSPRAAVRLLHALGALGAAIAFSLRPERRETLVVALGFLLLALVRGGLALGRRSCA